VVLIGHARERRLCLGRSDKADRKAANEGRPGGASGELFELAKITNKFCDDADLEGKGKSDAAAVAKFTSLLTTLKELSSILGIFLQAVAAATGSDDLVAKLMPLVIDLRATARKNKNFAVADKIRDGLAPTGITLEDRAGGTEWTGGGPNARPVHS